jgi:hypothetical protein
MEKEKEEERNLKIRRKDESKIKGNRKKKGPMMRK